MRFAQGFGHDQVQAVPNRVLGAVPEQRLGARVPVRDRAGGVGNHDGMLTHRRPPRDVLGGCIRC